jgi:putative colanic acid biosynthesis acetyltransferase WcaF
MTDTAHSASPGGPRFQDLSKFQLPKGARGRSRAVVQLWWIVQATLFRGSPQLFYGWRRFLLRLFGAKIGRGVLFRPSVTVTYPWNLTVGDYSWVGDDTLLYSLDRIDIGTNTALSQRVYLCTGSHDAARLSFDICLSPVRIGDECWIASDVFVAPGVSVGDGAVVGARSTVRHNLPPAMICFGNPAQAVRPRIRKA